MGTFASTLGMITGKVGNLRTSNWNGINVVAQQPTSYTDANTQVQQDNRATFKSAGQSLRQILAALRLGFGQFTNKTSPWAQAVKVNSDIYHIDGVTGLPVFDGNKVVVAQGDLPGVNNIAAVHANGAITLTWANNTASFGASASDVLNVCALSNDGEDGAVIAATALRSAGTLTFPVPSNITSATAHYYAFFATASGSKTSDSVEVQA